ncbi:UNKNOWN [Stylonychia lemnae]|uniref:Uncharacterized protein n=1 Tax=Stylonychia lemnae TaxID=5949 RepID=A0A078ACZ4_STYLE|nr:UNKNOWN [Stylonychia lemnae]|eukprot:CDW80120.1 UNKNOWN [Stylonychia lemnae]
MDKNFIEELKKQKQKNSGKNGNGEQKSDKQKIYVKKISQKQIEVEKNDLKKEINQKDQAIKLKADRQQKFDQPDEEEKRIPAQIKQMEDEYQIENSENMSNQIKELQQAFNHQENDYPNKSLIYNYNFDSLYQQERKTEPCLQCQNNLKQVQVIQEEIQRISLQEIENAKLINQKDQLNLELKKQLDDLLLRLRKMEEIKIEDQIIPSISLCEDKKSQYRQDHKQKQQQIMKIERIGRQQKDQQENNQSDIDLESQKSDWTYEKPKVNPKLDLVNEKYGRLDIYKKTPQDQFVTDDYETRNLSTRLAKIISAENKQLSRYICRNKKQVQIVRDCLKEFKNKNQESGKLIKKENKQVSIVDGQYRGYLTIFTFSNK